MKKVIFLFIGVLSMSLFSCSEENIEETITTELSEFIGTWDIDNINFYVEKIDGGNDNIISSDEDTQFEITENSMTFNPFGTTEHSINYSIVEYNYPIIKVNSENSLIKEFEIINHDENSLAIAAIIPEDIIASPSIISMKDIYYLSKQ